LPFLIILYCDRTQARGGEKEMGKISARGGGGGGGKMIFILYDLRVVKISLPLLSVKTPKEVGRGEGKKGKRCLKEEGKRSK